MYNHLFLVTVLRERRIEVRVISAKAVLCIEVLQFRLAE